MSMIQNVTRGYASFFWDCANFAVSPYTKTFLAVANPSGASKDDTLLNVAAAAVVTGILTFVIPVLPTLFSITCAIASVAASLAVASMFLFYPIALLNDLLEPANDNKKSYSCA